MQLRDLRKRCKLLQRATGWSPGNAFWPGLQLFSCSKTFSCSETHPVAVILLLCYAVQITKLGRNAKTILGQVLERVGHFISVVIQLKYAPIQTTDFLCTFCIAVIEGVRKLLSFSRSDSEDIDPKMPHSLSSPSAFASLAEEEEGHVTDRPGNQREIVTSTLSPTSTPNSSTSFHII